MYWANRVANDYLLSLGAQTVLDHEVRPVERNQRILLDLVTYDRERDEIVFNIVKAHMVEDLSVTVMNSMSKEEKRGFKTAIGAWMRRNKWDGGYRVDGIDIYGNEKGYNLHRTVDIRELRRDKAA